MFVHVLRSLRLHFLCNDDIEYARSLLLVEDISLGLLFVFGSPLFDDLPILLDQTLSVECCSLVKLLIVNQILNINERGRNWLHPKPSLFVLEILRARRHLKSLGEALVIV